MGAAAYAEPDIDCPPFFIVDSKSGDIIENNCKFICDGIDVNIIGADFLVIIKI